MSVQRPPFKLKVNLKVAVQNPKKTSVRAKKLLKDIFYGTPCTCNKVYCWTRCFLRRYIAASRYFIMYDLLKNKLAHQLQVRKFPKLTIQWKGKMAFLIRNGAFSLQVFFTCSLSSSFCNASFIIQTRNLVYIGFW